jgi:hypothetical protein
MLQDPEVADAHSLAPTMGRKQSQHPVHRHGSIDRTGRARVGSTGTGVKVAHARR